MKATAIAALLFACPLVAQTVPDIKPGDSCEALRVTYGKESSQEGPFLNWQRDAVKIRVFVKPNGPCVTASVSYFVEPGHTFTTRDGIVLGRDTLAEASLKLKGRVDSNNIVFIRGEGKAYANLEAPPTPTFPFNGIYLWQLNQAIADKLTAPPKLNDFTREPALYYSINSPISSEMSK